MTSHNQSHEELEAHLREQLQFLSASADAYDAGFEGEAKRIAVSIRVLVHDTGRSRSLLGQLGRKDQAFTDSALPLVAGNKVAHSGLVMTSMVPGARSKYVAFLDDAPDGLFKQVDFDTWWNAAVFVDSAGRTLSRKDLVLAVANQDGGAHVDVALNATYADLSRNNSLGWMYSDGTRSEPLGGPELAALRQIGHEVLKTLVTSYEKQPTYPDNGIVFGGMMVVREDSAPSGSQVISRSAKVGRNERCPCGSGRKYKHCCGALA